MKDLKKMTNEQLILHCLSKLLLNDFNDEHIRLTEVNKLKDIINERLPDKIKRRIE